MEIGFLLLSIVKIAALLAYLYGLLWVLGHASKWVKIGGLVLAFLIIQLALTIPIGDDRILSSFDSGLLFQSCAITMVSLGLNLIYGFNGQFSLGQWGFYGIGAYTAADITYRWVNGDARGLLIVGIGAALAGLAILGINQQLKKIRGVPVLSSFTLYIIGVILAGAIAIGLANLINPALAPLLGTPAAPGFLATGIPMQIVFFLAVILGGIFAAEVSFLFGLPVLTLGSDYFGIATLGFTIVVNVLMINSDTVLPFPEMKGGRGMLGIPQMGPFAWFWAFVFLVVVIVIMRNLVRSSTGRSILSVREDETAAKAMGIDIAGTKLLTFVIGSFVAGIGGAVYTHTTGTGFLSPGSFDFLVGFNPLIIVVFGGLGSMTGTIAASFGWTFFLEGLLRVLLSQMGTEAPTWRFVLYPIALLLLMLVRPQGLLGTVEWGFLKAKAYTSRRKTEAEPAAAGQS
jgi:branched-chain amino acid transport system permease protein